MAAASPAAAPSGAQQPSLTFTRPVFAKLSPHPYLLRTLSPDSPGQQPTRNNGRSPHQSRPIQINTSSLSQAHGSSLVRTGDTTVICGVRGELLPVTAIPQFRPHNGTLYDQDENDEERARKELRDYDLLVPNIEMATGCAPQFLPGVPPTTLAQTLSTRVYSLLHGAGVVDGRGLRVWYTPEKGGREGSGMEVEGEEGEQEEEEEQKPEVVAYWVLYIDLLFVSFDGNPFDAAWAAVLAALRDTELPVARWDPDREMVVCRKGGDKKLGIRGLPVACSAAVFLEKEHAEVGGGEGNRHWILLDPDRSEEGLCKEVVTVVVDCSEGETRVRSIEKQGGTVIGRELIRGFIGVAEGRWREVKEAMGN
ncbi:ribosomal protein S5 domain 2-type protein [Apiosordaria backusii]|uniref:Ribosomal RNA-processing protein 43 n=1 Tax=Apiosordaria backusii TaxID=314023 RepID=A0AA40BNV3_9PEZI|nr:ribosomal protein S5 domain 2-type protein [Apiosordaria backusii]